ncbi:hypothetical protein [Halothiobacillus sp.]|uniref:hypothetical protein n=1 Tax=Halothiobacillus sp. TaxID=1891311 RepID=UPI00261404F4|nr:hypothetical protein [Halothiobacillus sp.]
MLELIFQLITLRFHFILPIKKLTAQFTAHAFQFVLFCLGITIFFQRGRGGGGTANFFDFKVNALDFLLQPKLQG